MLKKCTNNIISSKYFTWDSISTRIYSASFWGITGSILNRLLLFFTSVVLIRLLTTKSYGEYSIARSTLATFVIFGSTGFGVTAMKYVSEYKKKSPERAGNVILLTSISVFILGIVSSLFISIFSFEIADKLLHRAELASIFRWMSISILIASITSVSNGILSGLECFSYITIINVISGVAVFAISSVLAYYFHIRGALIGLLCYFITNLLLCIFFISKKLKSFDIRVNLHNIKSEIPILWKFSAPSIFNSIILSGSVWVGNSVLVQQPSGLEMMAGFDILNQGRTMLLFIPMAINQSGLSILSSLLSENNYKEYKKAIIHYLKLNVCVTAFIALCIILGGKIFLRLYGESFETYYAALIVLVLSGLISVIANVCGNVIQSQGKAWVGFGFNFLWSVLFLFSVYYFLKRDWGVMGLCVSNLVTYLVHVILQIAYIYKIYK